MELIIRNSDSQPIYEQICAQIRALILSGQLAPGTALPSIRALAKDLKISVITTKRAYDELEADGFLVTVAGKGSFVAEQNLELARERLIRITQAEAVMPIYVRLAIADDAETPLTEEEAGQIVEIPAEEGEGDAPVTV